jgi:phosphoenolpyruvate carboxylase
VAKFTVQVAFHFDHEFEVYAASVEEAKQKALLAAETWKPGSTDNDETQDWYSVEIEGIFTDDDLRSSEQTNGV